MAGVNLTETRTIQVANDPKLINEVNRGYGRFFWNVQNVQVTHVKDSHLEFTNYGAYGVDVTTVTETTQYATITYVRDKTMPFYSEISALETRMNQVEEQIRHNRSDTSTWSKTSGFLKGGIACVVAGILIMLWLGSTGTAAGGAMYLAILGGAGLFCLFYMFPKRERERKAKLADLSSELTDELMPERERLEVELNELTERIMRQIN